MGNTAEKGPVKLGTGNANGVFFHLLYIKCFSIILASWHEKSIFFLPLHHIVIVSLKTKHRSWACSAGNVAKIRFIFKSSHCVVQKSLEHGNLKWIAVGWKPVTRKS